MQTFPHASVFVRSALLFAGLTLCTTAVAQRGFYIADDLEVTIKAPAKWTYLGGKGDLGSLRAMFCAPRGYDPTDGEGTMHTPTLRLLWFGKPEASAKDANASTEQRPRRTTYTSTKDYIDRVNGPDGKIADVESVTVGKFKGLRYVVDFPREVGTLTIHIVAIKTATGEFAVEFEVLKEQYKKMRGLFERALGTLAATPPEKVEQPADIEVPRWNSDYESWRKLPKADRDRFRADWGRKWLEARRTAFEPGWKVVKNKHWLVLSRTDSKYTKRITDAANVGRAWVEKRFANVSDDAIMPAVLRIFDSKREETAYRLRDVVYNADEYSWINREMFTYKDSSMGNLGDGYDGVLRAVFGQFIHDKHPLILNNMPRWLKSGIYGLTFSSRVLRGKKLIFFPHEVEMGRFKYHAEHNKPQCVWWFTHEKIITDPKDGAAEPTWGFTPECTRLLRWFDESGSKALNHDDLLSAYLAQVGATAATFRPNPQRGVDLTRLKDTAARDLNKEFYAWRAAFLEKINVAVIPRSNAGWQAIDKLWQAWNVEFAKRKFKKK